ncbi:SpoIIE family protein phosphatase [Streptacidiphilus pinicola]|nr:SpoIIE family protein phosphatase [Streptacidiphilus pinicola]
MESVLPTGGRGENVGAEAPKRDAAAAADDAADAVMADARGPAEPAAVATGLPSQVLAALPVGVALLDAELRWRYANDAFLRLTGLPPEASAGAPLTATALSRAGASGFGETAATAHAAALVLADGETRELVAGPTHEPIRMRLQRVAPDPGTGAQTPLVLVVALLDATQEAPATPSVGPAGATAAQAVPATAPDGPEAVTPAGASVAVSGRGGEAMAPASAPPEGELRARRRLATLTAAGERIGTTLDTDTTCAELAGFTVPGLADLATVDILPPGVPDHRLGMPLGTVRLLRAAVAGRPELHQQLATLAHPGESVRHREGSLVTRSLVAAKPVVLDLAAIDEGAEGAAAISDPATLEVYRAAGIASVVAVPLAARGHLVGALILARGAEFSDDDLALIEDLAARAALSIDNARRYTRSQGIALELQRALLAEPANPHPNMEIACRYLPSGSSSVVGGDWYESVRLPFGRTLLVIGDVMGHGVEAAVDMSTYRSMLRYVAVMDLPPHRILRQLDAMISENDAARPATCLLALVDPPRNRVTFASAGHLPPALVTPNGVTELVPVPSGPPLGTGVGGYQQLVRELGSGDVLLLYTDGLVERRHEDIDVSLERLAALPLPAAGDLDDLLDAALHSSTPSEAEDDIAVLAARVRLRP